MPRKEEVARRQLEQAGFDYVRSEIRSHGEKRKARADLVAWAADPDGEVRPYAAVEVLEKAVDSGRLDGALESLALVRDTLGTTAHFVYAGGQWFEADSGLREAHQLPGVPKPPSATPLTLADVEVATQLLNHRLWQLADFQRGQLRDAATAGLDALLDELAVQQGRIQFGSHAVSVPSSVLWTAIQRVVRIGLARDRYSENTSSDDISLPMACLLGEVEGVVYDPFAGLGSFLWAAGERAAAAGRSTVLRGVDINVATVALAGRIAALSPYGPQLEAKDSFEDPVDGIADFVVSEPPAGLRLPVRYSLAGAGDTNLGDVAAVDVALRALRPGGRAVLHLPAAWTFHAGAAQRQRDRLLEAANVVALIGLPPGTYAGTQIPSILLVVDNVPGTTETFVSQLGQDWSAQLSPGGAALVEFYERTNPKP